jgi:hypothetical protein
MNYLNIYFLKLRSLGKSFGTALFAEQIHDFPIQSEPDFSLKQNLKNGN